MQYHEKASRDIIPIQISMVAFYPAYVVAYVISTLLLQHGEVECRRLAA